MLTDLEAVFRALKSELGLRSVHHRTTKRVSVHLFISVLAYHLVHTIRLQLKACGIHLSWDGIRRELDGQARVTVELNPSLTSLSTISLLINPLLFLTSVMALHYARDFQHLGLAQEKLTRKF